MSKTTRNEQWMADGVKIVRAPKGHVQLSVRGGQGLSSVGPGDDVELYTGGEKKDQGVWVPGFVAVSGVRMGQMGGPYDGKEVVLVLRQEDTSPDKPGLHRGQEWPVELLRLEKGGSSKSQGQPDNQGNQDNASFSIGAAFFRFDPAQLRGYHGRWADEGKQPLPLVKEPIPEYTPKEAQAGREYMESIGVTPEGIADRIVSLVRTIPKKLAVEKNWYQTQHDQFIEPWAKAWDIQAWRVAGATSALSPQTKWAEDNLNPFSNSNQSKAIRVMSFGLDPAWTQRKIHISEEFVKAIDEALWREYVKNQQKEKHPIDEGHRKSFLKMDKYNGMDPNFKKGQSLVGDWKFGDLPADVAIMLVRKSGIGMRNNASKALLIVRGEDPSDILGGGGKTRSFYNNLLDPVHSQDATVDVHMARAIVNNPNLSDDDLKAMTGFPERYAVLSQGVKMAAKRLGMAPHQAQAIAWFAWKEKHDPASRSAATKAGKTGMKKY